MKNKIQLIAYVDRLGGGDIRAFTQLFDAYFKELFGGVHLLPFFYPIDGEDAGFDPIDHKRVDPGLGDWNDIRDLGRRVDVMADLIVNHMSADSTEFRDFLAKGDKSEYASLFLTYETIFPNGATQSDLLHIYRPRPGFPFTRFGFGEGGDKLVWTTFTRKQVDINVRSVMGKAHLLGILDLYKDAGISMIRLDAAGYAIKKAGTTCFMIPETFAFISHLTQEAKTRGIEVLVEIHSHYRTQIEIARKVDYTYDFALPVLVLDLLFNKRSTNLVHWLGIAPRNVVTVLDTHDGIGIVDVASQGAEKGLIPDTELDKIVEKIHTNSGSKSRKATGAAASNLDLYQVNCTYFEALGRKENEYLIARAVQFFVPGIPQVYYVGLFGDDNDMELLARTGVGRDINRHYYSVHELQGKVNSPRFVKLAGLMRLRNTHPAFNGEFRLLETPDDALGIQWDLDGQWIRLELALPSMRLRVIGTENGSESIFFEI